MLIVAYVINQALVQGVNSSNGGATSCSGITLISLFVILTGGNITWIIVQFIYFGSCSG